MKKILVGLSLISSLVSQAQDHGHFNIGAISTAQNDPLIFANRDIFDTTTNYVKTLTFTNGGPYAGYYQGNITLTGLAATEAHAGPDDFAAALGTQIHAQLVAVAGPAGGAFAFWETGATSPTISLACGTTGTNTWRVSENDGSAGSDPYGHIHGRRFTATKPGIYTVSFRAFDFSTNGISGGPIHTPSDVVQVYFQAGVNIKSIALNADQTDITFSAPAGKAWVLDTSDNVATNAVSSRSAVR
ncbi:MAG: hypothetical protein QM813_01175 [Verrucomicrobiota bacterium]